jgi:hypothetical protein
VFKENFVVNLVSCKTDCDLLKFRNNRREMEVPVTKGTFFTQEIYL